MSRLTNDRHALDVAALRAEFAGLAVGVKLIRLERVLSRKYRPDSPARQLASPMAADGFRRAPAAKPRLKRKRKTLSSKMERGFSRSGFGPNRIRTGTSSTRSPDRMGHERSSRPQVSRRRSVMVTATRFSPAASSLRMEPSRRRLSNWPGVGRARQTNWRGGSQRH